LSSNTFRKLRAVAGGSSLVVGALAAYEREALGDAGEKPASRTVHAKAIQRPL
jgi:hypothetical protein